jgi:hypothetical protein
MNDWTDPEFDRPSAPQSGDREDEPPQDEPPELPPGCVTASEILAYWRKRK